MSRHETRWVLLYATFLVILTSLPYVVAALNQGSDWAFSGFLIAVEDGNSYIAKMLSGGEGAWLFKSPYTAQEQAGVIAFVPYLLLGKLSSGMHGQLVLLYHLFRVLSIPVLVLAVYRFAAHFIDTVPLRRWTTIIATIGGGLGWLLILLGRPVVQGSIPLEFYSPETFGFLALYGIPHLTLARAAMLLGFAWYLDERGGWRSGFALLGAGIVHSPELISAFAAIGAHTIAVLGFGSSKRKWAYRLGRAALPSIPLLIYLGYSAATDPYLQAWTEQNIILSPAPVLYLLAFGLMLPAAYVGARALLRRAQASMLFPISWVLIIPVLIWAPLNVQRRLPEGGWVALTVLAAAGIGTLRSEHRRVGRIALATLLIPSTLVVLITGVAQALNPREPAFQPLEQTKAFIALRRSANSGDVVLADFSTSNAIPAWAPVRVVAGHGPESAGLQELRPKVADFFLSSTSSEARLVFLEDQGVDFLFYSSKERALGDWEPAQWECLDLVHSQGEYELYRTCLP